MPQHIRHLFEVSVIAQRTVFLARSYYIYFLPLLTSFELNRIPEIIKSVIFAP